MEKEIKEVTRIKEKLKGLEKKLKYSFSDKSLLLRSMLHSSFVNENKPYGFKSNERLEFLGDAVLELVISHYLMEHFPNENEGILSAKRAGLVREGSLAKLARVLRLHQYILVGVGEKKEDGNKRDSVLSDALEALFGAVYLDSSIDVARKVILKVFSPILKNIEKIDKSFNFKNQLIQYSQNKYKSHPQFKVAKIDGPEHQRRFRVNVYMQEKFLTFGMGTSIKKAEQVASKNALRLIAKRNTEDILEDGG